MHLLTCIKVTYQGDDDQRDIRLTGKQLLTTIEMKIGIEHLSDIND